MTLFNFKCIPVYIFLKDGHVGDRHVGGIPVILNCIKLAMCICWYRYCIHLSMYLTTLSDSRIGLQPTFYSLIFISLHIRSYILFIFRTLTFRHRASCILGQAFHYSPENAFYIFNHQIYFIFLIFASLCIIDINNIDNQLDATITAY